MSGVGVALTFSDSWERIIGSVLVSVGGILVTSGTAIAFSREQALEAVGTRLIALNQTIATACGHIERVADGLLDDTVDGPTLSVVIENSLQYLTAAGSQIQDIVGRKLDSGALMQTIRDFRQLRAALRSAHDQAVKSGANETAEEISQVQSQLTKVASQVTALAQVENVQVDCPYCGMPCEAELGKAAGSGGMSRCEACGKKFYLHRRSTGELLARQRGKKNAKPDTRIECPSCRTKIPIYIRPGEAESQRRWCLDCFAKLKTDAAKGIVLDWSADKPLSAEVAGTSSMSGYALLVCPQCGAVREAFARRGTSVFAACYECDCLLKGSVGNSSDG